MFVQTDPNSMKGKANQSLPKWGRAKEAHCFFKWTPEKLASSSNKKKLKVLL
jgi:hypothetical protein